MKRNTFDVAIYDHFESMTGYHDSLLGVYRNKDSSLWHVIHLTTGESFGYFEKMDQAKAMAVGLETVVDCGQPTLQLIARSGGLTVPELRIVVAGLYKTVTTPLRKEVADETTR